MAPPSFIGLHDYQKTVLIFKASWAVREGLDAIFLIADYTCEYWPDHSWENSINDRHVDGKSWNSLQGPLPLTALRAHLSKLLAENSKHLVPAF